MPVDVMEVLSRRVFYPLWDIKERADRLAELKRLEESQFWPRERLGDLQLQRLQKVLLHAYESCRFYRELWDSAGVSPHVRSLEDLRRFPTIGKRDIRARLDDFISSRFRREHLYEARTGGSTGVALTVYFDKRCQEYRNAAAMRSDRWAGRDLGTKTAALWGNPPRDVSIKDRLRSALLGRMIYLDTMAINEEALLAFVDIWRRERPRIIFGHAHSIFMLAVLLRDRGITCVRPEGIIATSMMLLEKERRVIEEVLGCRVSNRYGCEEVGLIAAECPQHSGLHINAEHLVVECLDADDQPVAEGGEGEIVLTDLVNYGMPLIRYRVEDVGVWSGRKCPCGRGSPLLERIVGRTADFLVKQDGTLVAGVSLVERTLTRFPGIEQMQIVQESIDRIRVNVVRGRDYDAASESGLRAELTAVFGPRTAIDIVHVDRLDQDRQGKFRFSICKLHGRASTQASSAA